MSIWCSWREIGWEDPWVALRKGKRLKKPHHGDVRSYAEGFSNHYPTRAGDVELRANVGIAHIPVWCVPGHADDETDDHVTGEWVRLDVYTAEHDWHNPTSPTGKWTSAAVVMDEEAARALAADLLEWADRPKAYPTGDTP